MKTLIRHATVLTMDEKNTVFKNGCVLIDGDRSVKAGEEEELQAEARKWGLGHGGNSGRAAQQLINYLSGRSGLKT